MKEKSQESTAHQEQESIYNKEDTPGNESPKKFLLIGGRIDLGHTYEYITAEVLLELYNLDPELCILREEIDPPSYIGEGKLIALYPCSDGNYRETLRQKMRTWFAFNGFRKVKRARRKTKWQPKEEWAKKLKRKGKV